MQHPTFYKVRNNPNGDGTKIYTRHENILSGPYYRWDNSVLPRTEEFPPNFRMIAASTDNRANLGGESGGNMLTECCNMIDNGGPEPEENCETWDRLHFPTRTCDFLGVAFGK